MLSTVLEALRKRMESRKIASGTCHIYEVNFIMLSILMAIAGLNLK
jgi:hypothetical protein